MLLLMVLYYYYKNKKRQEMERRFCQAQIALERHREACLRRQNEDIFKFRANFFPPNPSPSTEGGPPPSYVEALSHEGENAGSFVNLPLEGDSLDFSEATKLSSENQANLEDSLLLSGSILSRDFGFHQVCTRARVHGFWIGQSELYDKSFLSWKVFFSPHDIC